MQRASGVPHALCLKEGQGSCTTRAHRAAGSRAHVCRALKIEPDVRNAAPLFSQPVGINVAPTLPPRHRCPLDRMPASRLLLPRSGLERSDFVL